jgi:hypothetical protein
VNVTAKVVLNCKIQHYPDAVGLSFVPDYQDGRNKEWASATPALSVSMTVKDAVAEHFTAGQAYTLTFAPEES